MIESIKIPAEKEEHYYIAGTNHPNLVTLEEAIKRKDMGFKWFPQDLVCRGFQYKIDHINCYEKEPRKGISGFHFHPTPFFRTDDIQFRQTGYGYNTSYTDCWIVYLPGSEHVGSDNPQSIYTTDKIELVRKVTLEEQRQYVKKANREALLQQARDTFNIDTILDLASKFPNLVFGGSSALFLYGISPLERNRKGDIDIIMPFYEDITGNHEERPTSDDHDDIGRFKIEKISDKSSGNDFGVTLSVEGSHGFSKIDVGIDPYVMFNTIQIEGVKVRLALPEVILKYKLKYALNGQQKHLDDIYQMMGIKDKLNKIKKGKVKESTTFEELWEIL